MLIGSGRGNHTLEVVQRTAAAVTSYITVAKMVSVIATLGWQNYSRDYSITALYSGQITGSRVSLNGLGQSQVSHVGFVKPNRFILF